MSEKSDGSTAGYYELPEDARELIELIGHRDMNHQIGTIFSSCYRYGLVEHSDQLREAKKILFYALAEVARLLKADGCNAELPIMMAVMRDMLHQASLQDLSSSKMGRHFEEPNESTIRAIGGDNAGRDT